MRWVEDFKEKMVCWGIVHFLVTDKKNLNFFSRSRKAPLTMQSSTLAKPQVSQQINRLPIKVVFVLKSLQDAGSPDIKGIREYSQQQNLHVECREYDSSQYRHDRDQIERLPALHIYVNNIYERTFYPNGRPYQIIEETVFQYKRKVEERLARKGGFKRFMGKLLERIKSMSHRKTRMEKYEEEQREHERRRSQSFRDRLPSMADWN